MLNKTLRHRTCALSSGDWTEKIEDNTHIPIARKHGTKAEISMDPNKRNKRPVEKLEELPRSRAEHIKAFLLISKPRNEPSG